MTHSVNAPLPPPTTGGATTSGATTQGIDSPSSTKDVAKNEAANVGQTAKEAGTQVASTAADQAKEVAATTKRQAQDLLQQGRSQVRQQAVGQQQKAAQGLSSIAGELRGLANGTSQGAPGPARDLLEQASDKVEEFSTWLQNREPADLLDEVRNFARRKPGVFLLGAAAAGILAGRLTSGVKAVHTDSSGGDRNMGGRYSGGTDYVDTTPAYTGYETGTVTTTTGYETGTVGTTGTYAGTTTGYTETTGTGTPLPPPPYGTVPPAGSVVPPTTPAGWDDPARGTGEVR
jgi:ElaB/YqjD/DUF883 family membrane-anchored ribosome-binding protein